MNRPHTRLPKGTSVRTHERLGSTEAFPVKGAHIEARRAGAFGTIDRVVPGSRHEHYWVRHPPSLVFAVYHVNELERYDAGDEDVPTTRWIGA